METKPLLEVENDCHWRAARYFCRPAVVSSGHNNRPRALCLLAGAIMEKERRREKHSTGFIGLRIQFAAGKSFPFKNVLVEQFLRSETIN